MKSENEIFQNYIKNSIKLMNTKIDACEDFLEYSSGNLDRSNHETPAIYFSTLFERILGKEQINFLSFIKAKNFYNCLQSEKNFKQFSDKIGLSEKIGGWPAYDQNWIDKNFDFTETIAILASFGLQTVLHHRQKFLSHENIAVFAARRITYNADKKKILQKLGVDDDLISEIISDIEEIKVKISKIPPMRFPQLNCFKVVQIFKFNEVKYKEKFDFIKYFELYQDKSIEDYDSCHLENTEYLIEYLQVLSSSKPKVLLNYLFFLAGQDFLEKEFKLDLTIKYFAPTLITSGFATYYQEFDKKKHDEALKWFQNSFEKIKNKFEKSGWRQVQSYLVDSEETQNFKNTNFQQDLIESSFDELNISPTDYFQNIRNLQIIYPTEAHKKCLSKDFDTSNNYRNMLKFLLYALHNHEKPMVHYFIGNIFRMWRDIIYSFTIELNNVQLYPNDLIKDQMKEFNFPEFYNCVNLFKGTSLALQQTLDDYNEWLEENEELAKFQENFLKSLGLDNEKIFFILFAQRDSCKERNIANASFLALLNNRRLSEIFECKINSKMNKNNKFLAFKSKAFLH